MDAEPITQHIDGVRLQDFEAYKTLYKQSIGDDTRDSFWDKVAKENISWFSNYETVFEGGFETGDVRWFVGGKLNASFNCVDRHARNTPDKVAILWEGNEPNQVRKITYRELLHEVCRFANLLIELGVKKGDAVCIYMPMVPEAAYAMLACARIGAPHSVVFAGFSAAALRDRINDANCKILITADEGLRGKKKIPLKATCDSALFECPTIEKCIIYKHTNTPDLQLHAGRDIILNDVLPEQRPYCPPLAMDSEDPLFYLYTSGSTGQPKGLVHTTGGYMVYTSLTFQYSFDYREDDVYACVADIGWITGHSYIIYGPLASGATTFMFESLPLYPDSGRYWDMVQRHKISVLYTAPTAIRALMKYGDENVKKYDRSSLRILGTVGEPINPEAWHWFYKVVGEERCAISDTYWQTETGGHVLTSLPGITPMKAGAAGYPFFGIEPILIDSTSGDEIKGNNVDGVLCFKKPWPGMARTVKGNHQRYLNVYLKPYKNQYFTSDGAFRDKDSMLWITGRVDDVVNVSGHRLGTAEVESAIVSHAACAEAAVVGFDHPIKGQGICAYVIIKEGYENSPSLVLSLQEQVKTVIGGIARPDIVLIVPGLPKTRSGKIMRRILRKIANGEADQLGDISTLADSSVVPILVSKMDATKVGLRLSTSSLR